MDQTIDKLFRLTTAYSFRGIVFQNSTLTVEDNYYYVLNSKGEKSMEGCVDPALSETMSQRCYQPLCVSRISDRMKSGYILSAASEDGVLRCVEIYAQEGFHFKILKSVKNSASVQYLDKACKDEWFDHVTNTFIALMKQSNEYRLPLVTGSLTFQDA